MHKKIVINFLTIILIITACAALSEYGKLEKEAREQYNQGKYDTALKFCVSSLKQKPDYSKSQELIQTVFRLAIEDHEKKITQSKDSMNKFKWDQVVHEYNAIQELYDLVGTLPELKEKETGKLITLTTKDNSTQIVDAKNKAAESHYSEGDRLSKIKNLDSQKQAAKEFKLALEFIPAYQDASERYEVCRKAGIKRIAIIPFENKSGKTSYGAIEEMITDNIISNVMNDPSAMEFLEIVSRGELLQVMQEQNFGMSGMIDDQSAIELGKILGVHELVTGKITQIAYTPPRTSSNSFDEENEVVVGEETYYDKKGKKRTRSKWGVVKAVVTRYTKTVSSSINGSYKIIDVATAKIKNSDSFKGHYLFNDEWGKYRGNIKALSRSSNNLCSRQEGFPPGPEEMINRSAIDLSNKLAETLKNYAR